jgi:hypothetical protein
VDDNMKTIAEHLIDELLEQDTDSTQQADVIKNLLELTTTISNGLNSMSRTLGAGQTKAACVDALSLSKQLESKLQSLQSVLITSPDIDAMEIDNEQFSEEID